MSRDLPAPSTPPIPVINSVNDSALLFDVGSTASLEIQSRVWALADQVSAWPHVQEAVVGMSSVLVIYDPLRVEVARLEQDLFALWPSIQPRPVSGKTVVVDVAYGGAAGCDLPDVAQELGMSEREVVDRHKGAEYFVYASGSSPGFAYLAGMPAALSIPRKAVPVLRAEAGSLLIGGSQTGVTASAGPTGWHVIGRTPMSMFDPYADPPVKLVPGDRVVFREVAHSS